MQWLVLRRAELLRTAVLGSGAEKSQVNPSHRAYPEKEVKERKRKQTIVAYLCQLFIHLSWQNSHPTSYSLLVSANGWESNRLDAMFPNRHQVANSPTASKGSLGLVRFNSLASESRTQTIDANNIGDMVL